MLPALIASWHPHGDMINSLLICERNDRTLVVSASADGSVQVWDVYGICIGTFGQVSQNKFMFCLFPICLECSLKQKSEHKLLYSGYCLSQYQDFSSPLSLDFISCS